MLAFTVRRTLAAIVMLIVMSIVTFGIFYVSPRDPAKLTCGRICPEQVIEENRKFLGYSDPIQVQYGKFVKGLFVGREYPDDKALREAAPQLVQECKAPCLGYSPLRTSMVWDLVKERLPVSIFVVIYAFVLWITFGVLGGIVAALFKGRWPDRLITGVALIGYSFPTFFIGITLYSYLASKWQLVPNPEYISPVSDFFGFLSHAILPALTLAAVYIAAYIRITRAYVIEAMGEDYLRTARAKGLSERKVIFKHTLRAALTPITTIAGLDLGVLLAGAAITETVFNFNGLGKLTVESAVTSDLPVNVAIVLIAASFILVANIVVDVLYAYIDPRVRFA